MILKGFLIFQGLLGTLLDYPNGGDEEDRTPDLRIANATLSQLSYAPIAGNSSSRLCPGRLGKVLHRALLRATVVPVIGGSESESESEYIFIAQ